MLELDKKLNLVQDITLADGSPAVAVSLPIAYSTYKAYTHLFCKVATELHGIGSSLKPKAALSCLLDACENDERVRQFVRDNISTTTMVTGDISLLDAWQTGVISEQAYDSVISAVIFFTLVSLLPESHQWWIASLMDFILGENGLYQKWDSKDGISPSTAIKGAYGISLTSLGYTAYVASLTTLKTNEPKS